MGLRRLSLAVAAVGLLAFMPGCKKEEEGAAERKKPGVAEEKDTAADTQEQTPDAPKKRQATWDLDGELAPEIHVATWINTDKPLTLQEFRKKKFVLLEFWFTSCPHCLKEVERMQEFHRRFNGRLLQVITVVSDLKDDRQKVEAFLKKHHATFPIGIDENAKTFTEYAMRRVPFVYIINPHGYVIWQGHPHYLEASQIMEMLEDVAK